MIVCDPRNPTATAMADALAAHLPEGVPGEALVVVIGGDGFLLRTVADRGLAPIYLGLNAGHLGFLLNDVGDWAETAAQIARRAFHVHAFPLLRAEITTAAGAVVIDHAINDVYLERATSQTAQLKLTIDGQSVVERMVADGIVFSTALGSTAYSFSAGGPACHPTLRQLVVTSICAHRPRLPPFCLPADALAVVDVHVPDRRPVRAVADGRAVDDVVRVTLRFDGSEVRLAYLPGHDFTSRMVRKILHP